jgi:LysM repeat protein
MIWVALRVWRTCFDTTRYIKAGDIDAAVMKPLLLVDGDNLEAVSIKSVPRESVDEELIMKPALDLDQYKSDSIIIYEVKDGDTLASIAKLLDVSKNTIAWANDIKDGKVKPGQSLLILPVTGVTHKIKKGDTLASIAKTYKADKDEIASYNGYSDGDSLSAGDTLIIPDGEVVPEPDNKKSNKTIAKKPATKVFASAGDGYYTRPILGGVRTQGIHGHNGIDIGAPVGTQLVAAADGTVIAAKSGGYNGGYGSMVIINHPNGTQTVYGHMSRVDVVTGQSVVKGQGIGLSGNTGRSTGPHLHFEVRKGEFAQDPLLFLPQMRSPAMAHQ